MQQVLLPGRRDGRRGELDEDMGARRVGLHARVHVDLVRQPVALAAVARRAGGDDVVPPRASALGARDHVVDREARAGAAVLALPAVARKDGAPGDLALVRIARDPHVRDEPDDHRPRQRARRPVQVAAADLDDLGLALEQEHRRSSDLADVDRLVRRVEDEHTTPRPTAAAVGGWSVPWGVVRRHGPQWCWGYGGCGHRWRGSVAQQTGGTGGLARDAPFSSRRASVERDGPVPAGESEPDGLRLLRRELELALA